MCTQKWMSSSVVVGTPTYKPLYQRWGDERASSTPCIYNPEDRCSCHSAVINKVRVGATLSLVEAPSWHAALRLVGVLILALSRRIDSNSVHMFGEAVACVALDHVPRIDDRHCSWLGSECLPSMVKSGLIRVLTVFWNRFWQTPFLKKGFL
jgi:hypothetical protein